MGEIAGEASLPAAAAWAAALCWGLALAWRDVTRRRLDDALTLPGAAVALAACWWAGDGAAALAGAVSWSGLHLAGALARPGSVGGGDVKLALALGAVAGTAGPVALCAAIALAGVATAVLGAVAGPRPPHGPSMLAATAVVAAWP